MSDSNSAPVRYVGLDIHKAYLVAAAVNADQEAVYGPRRVPLTQLSDWIVSDLLCTDRVVLEMTTNTWAMCDALAGHVASVTVVHPPQVALIVRARVMTDRKAALILAQLHAAHLLPAVWIPPQPVRDLRTLIAQRQKMVRLTTTARNRLHAVLRDLLPGGAPTGLSADKAAALMKGVRPVTATDNCRRDIARDLLADLRRLDRQVKDNEAEMREAVAITAGRAELEASGGVNVT